MRRARCPDCRTFTAVAIGPGYECHACGREFGAGLVRVPQAWGEGGESMAEAARLPLPYPETAVVEEDTLDEQTLALAIDLPERPLVLGGCCCSHVGAVEGARRAQRPDRARLDRRARRPEHGRELAVREPVGDAAADDPRLRRGRPAGRDAWSARATSTRPSAEFIAASGLRTDDESSTPRSTGPRASTSRSTSTCSSRARSALHAGAGRPHARRGRAAPRPGRASGTTILGAGFTALRGRRRRTSSRSTRLALALGL